jgi:hypothetical protein
MLEIIIKTLFMKFKLFFSPYFSVFGSVGGWPVQDYDLKSSPSSQSSQTHGHAGALVKKIDNVLCCACAHSSDEKNQNCVFVMSYEKMIRLWNEMFASFISPPITFTSSQAEISVKTSWLFTKDLFYLQIS